jgi:hypothetical protein
MKLLIKLNFKTDNNLFNIIDSFYQKMEHPENNILLLNINNELIIDEEKLNSYENLFYFKENVHPKIDFINSNIDKIKDWDFLLTSETLFKPKYYFDSFIFNNAISRDIVWYNDNQKESNTFSMKKEYYDKFGYIFNPIYHENYYYEEFKDILKELKNDIYLDRKLFEKDEFDVDKFIFDKRKDLKYNIENIEKQIIQKIKPIEKPKPIEKIKTKPQNNVINKNIKSEYEIIKNYLNTDVKFFIYKDGVKIFHSLNNRNNINVYPEYFEIYKRKYNYFGIQIKFN